MGRILLAYALFGLATAILAIATTSAAVAQQSVNRQVVQPTNSAEVERLNAALRRLARRPQDVDALIDAGNSAIRLNDLDAALGFLGRAQELSPNNAEAKIGLAVVYLRSRRPIEALRLFAEAERAGANSDRVAGDRGLAYDLVGNNSAAQASYRMALARSPSDEISRRLALSLAISGDKPGFEAVLLPMLQRRDYGAYRIRAFGLAILGEEEEAVSIANAVMPRDLAGRIAPYLAYMPRLTKAQQAAAANLGIFPRAAEIGRDDPRIAQYATTPAQPLQADSRLAPLGEPLDRPQLQAETQVATQADRQVVIEAETPAIQAQTRAGKGSRIGPETAAEGGLQPTTQLAKSPENAVRRRPDMPPSRVEEDINAPLASLFGDLSSNPPSLPSAQQGAVDITTIEAPIEQPRETPPQPEAHPSRIWVQVATGRDLAALAFDWRRIKRRNLGLLGEFDGHVVKWGQANRLLAGPIANREAARRLVNDLKRDGQDSFIYVSPQGQNINKIQ